MTYNNSIDLDSLIRSERNRRDEIAKEAFLCHCNPDDGKYDQRMQQSIYHADIADALEQLAEYREIGTLDRQKYINNQLGSYFERLQEIKDDMSFYHSLVSYAFKESNTITPVSNTKSTLDIVLDKSAEIIAYLYKYFGCNHTVQFVKKRLDEIRSAAKFSSAEWHDLSELPDSSTPVLVVLHSVEESKLVVKVGVCQNADKDGNRMWRVNGNRVRMMVGTVSPAVDHTGWYAWYVVAWQPLPSLSSINIHELLKEDPDGIF